MIRKDDTYVIAIAVEVVQKGVWTTAPFVKDVAMILCANTISPTMEPIQSRGYKRRRRGEKRQSPDSQVLAGTDKEIE